ncbi:hypothetical protein JCM19055_4356 [Geomicrobium sp. JCM 19055]|nr:hypothetical protein JCM19055_4356 [Geomicrobium sp. JCM 19055]
MIIAAFPFSIILLMMVFSLIKSLRSERSQFSTNQPQLVVRKQSREDDEDEPSTTDKD